MNGYIPPADACAVPAGINAWSLAKAKAEGTITFECQKCGRLSVVEVSILEKRFPAETQLREISRRMRCTCCGRCVASALVRRSWGRGDRAWLPRPPRLSR